MKVSTFQRNICFFLLLDFRLLPNITSLVSHYLVELLLISVADATVVFTSDWGNSKSWSGCVKPNYWCFFLWHFQPKCDYSWRFCVSCFCNTELRILKFYLENLWITRKSQTTLSWTSPCRHAAEWPWKRGQTSTSLYEFTSGFHCRINKYRYFLCFCNIIWLCFSRYHLSLHRKLQQPAIHHDPPEPYCLQLQPSHSIMSK